MATTPDQPNLDELARRAHEGDVEARAALVAEATPLLRRMARRYAGRGVEFDDLVQDAVVGLLRALARYEPERGTPFMAWARLWVRQALQQALAERLRPLRLPTHVLWDLHELKEMRERLTREHGHEPRAVELADALGWSEGRVHEVLQAERPGEQLDRIADGREASLADLLDDPLAADAYEDVLDRLALAQLRPLVLRLTERERQVLALRADGGSLREVGRMLGVSGERVRALENRAVAKLRAGARSGVDTGQRLLTRKSESPNRAL